MENSQLMSRTLAGLTGVNQECLIDHNRLIEVKVGEVKGDIRFIRYKSTKTTVDTLKLKIEELKSRNFFPDVIIVDGLNQLKLPVGRRTTDNNDKYEFLSEQLKVLGYEEQCPVFAAFQSNRGGFNVEYADEQNIGKAIEVYQVCDLMIMLTQSLPMFDAGECYAQLLKNRLGKKGITLRLKYDPNQGLFQEIEEVSRLFLLNKKEKAEISKGLNTVREKLDKEKKKKIKE
jgi:hypothetical protein